MPLALPFAVDPRRGPVGVAAVEVDLQLLGRRRMNVRVPADKDSEPVMFELRADTPGPRPVSVTAWLGGSYLGELLVEVTAEQGRPAGTNRDVLAQMFTTLWGAKSPPGL